MQNHSLIERLISRIDLPAIPTKEEKKVKVKNTTSRKQPHAGYFHVSSKVVIWKDNDGVEHEGLMGVSWKHEFPRQRSRRKKIRAGVCTRSSLNFVNV